MQGTKKNMKFAKTWNLLLSAVYIMYNPPAS